jgi:hypothetical protein
MSDASFVTSSHSIPRRRRRVSVVGYATSSSAPVADASPTSEARTFLSLHSQINLYQEGQTRDGSLASVQIRRNGGKLRATASLRDSLVRRGSRVRPAAEKTHSLDFKEVLISVSTRLCLSDTECRMDTHTGDPIFARSTLWGPTRQYSVSSRETRPQRPRALACCRPIFRAQLCTILVRSISTIWLAERRIELPRPSSRKLNHFKFWIRAKPRLSKSWDLMFSEAKSVKARLAKSRRESTRRRWNEWRSRSSNARD